MIKKIFSMILVAMILLSCAGNKTEKKVSFLMPVLERAFTATVQPTGNLLFFQATLKVDRSAFIDSPTSRFLLNQYMYLESVQINGEKVEAQEVLKIYREDFGENLSQDDWLRIGKYARLYSLDFSDVPSGNNPVTVEMKYNLKLNDMLETISVSNDEIMLDGVGFWYPSTLQENMPTYIEVVAPGFYEIICSDGEASIEELDKKLNRTVFDFTSAGLPVLVEGYK